MITLIAALDEDRIIGRDGTLPWHVPGDLKFFRRTTTGHVVIMGRTTWQHLAEAGYNTAGPYLDKRVNFVITRDPAGQAAALDAPPHETFGPHFVDTIELALSTAKRRFPEYATEFFLCGGRQIYELALRRGLPDRMLLTHIEGKHIGDTTFPPFDESAWTGRQIERGEGFGVVEYTPR
jgi:dihydrofolate reductase